MGLFEKKTRILSSPAGGEVERKELGEGYRDGFMKNKSSFFGNNNTNDKNNTLQRDVDRVKNCSIVFRNDDDIDNENNNNVVGNNTRWEQTIRRKRYRKKNCTNRKNDGGYYYDRGNDGDIDDDDDDNSINNTILPPRECEKMKENVKKEKKETKKDKRKKKNKKSKKRNNKVVVGVMKELFVDNKFSSSSKKNHNRGKKSNINTINEQYQQLQMRELKQKQRVLLEQEELEHYDIGESVRTASTCSMSISSEESSTTTTTTTLTSSMFDDNILNTDYHRDKYMNILTDDIRDNDDDRRHRHHCDDHRHKHCVSNNIILWKNSIDTSFSLGSKNVLVSRSQRRFERQKVVRNNIYICLIFIFYTIMHYLLSPNGYALRNTRYDYGINNQSMGFSGIIHCLYILSLFVVMQTYLSSSSSTSSSSSSSCFTTTTTTTSPSSSSSSNWSYNCHERKNKNKIAFSSIYH